MLERRSLILKAIIQSYIRTGSPVGSQQLREEYNLPYSPATIRNEMMQLEEAGEIVSPHTSAGRVPTEKALRLYAEDERTSYDASLPDLQTEWDEVVAQQRALKRADFKVYETVSAMTHLTQNVSFASVPSQERVYFLGMSNLIVQPEFAADPELASGVFRILEDNFDHALEQLPLDEEDGPKIYLGEENLISDISSIALVVSKFTLLGRGGYVGVLGPMRMDYKRNLGVVQLAQQTLRGAPELMSGEVDPPV